MVDVPHQSIINHTIRDHAHLDTLFKTRPCCMRHSESLSKEIY